MSLPSSTFPVVPALERRTPLEALAEMTLPASGVVPPTVLPAAATMAIPTPVFASPPMPLSSVPIRLAWTTLPVAPMPLISRPDPAPSGVPLPEIRFPAPAVGLFFGLFFAPVGGLFFGLVVGLESGGLACLKHVVLRLALIRNRSTPWNYVRFLDYAAERILRAPRPHGPSAEELIAHQVMLQSITEPIWLMDG